jgi:pyruvate, orthophosphate dikinase
MAVTTGAGTRSGAAGSTQQQWVFLAQDAPATDKDLLGGKGAGLAAMTQAGLPVPAAFTITTAACNAYQKEGGKFPPGLWEQTLEALHTIEQQAGKRQW